LSDSLHYKLVIIGSGPAGLSAALYAARAELQPLLFTGMVLHGQVSLTHTIENYPGHPEGIGGDALGILFRQQAERFGTIVEYDQVTKVDLKKKPFIVSTYSKSYTTDAVIISTGANPKKLNVEGESDFTGRGVSYCGTCDGWFFKNKGVAVVGGGDSSLEEAIFLTRYARSVTIIHRRNELRAGKILEHRALSNPKISFLWDTIVTGIYGGTGVDHVSTKNTKTGEEKQISFDGVFIFIGHTPNTELFKGQISLDELGYIIVDQRMRTNIPGVFAAGEVADPHYRQVVTSAGMGAAAGIEAVRFLAKSEKL
jgi:thioredoxin reductase (NADPH)